MTDESPAAARRTARLLLRPPAPEDLEGYERLLLDPAVGAWLRPPPLEPMTEAEAFGLLSADVKHWADHGFGPWTLLEPGAGEMVGRGGLRRTLVDGRTEVELPWALRPDRWGEGLATEAARAAIEWAGELGLGRVVALIRPENRASIAVAGRVGLVAAGTTVHAGLEHLVYGLEP